MLVIGQIHGTPPVSPGRKIHQQIWCIASDKSPFNSRIHFVIGGGGGSEKTFCRMQMHMQYILDNNGVGGLVLKFKTQRVARGLQFQIQDLPRGYYVVYKRTTPIFYCSQEVLSKIPKPIENNRKWVWWVYKYV